MIEYPVRGQAADLSASRGVMRADDRVAFVEAFERLRALLASPEVRAERVPDEGATTPSSSKASSKAGSSRSRA